MFEDLDASDEYDAVIINVSMHECRDIDKVTQNVLRALKPGGHLFLDYLNPDHVLRNLVEMDERRVNGKRIVQQRRFDRHRQRVIKRIQIIEGEQTREFVESVRLYRSGQMRAFLEQSGFSDVTFYGDFAGKPFHSDSPRMILIGRKGRSH
jgi:SAM-dependent methyltransferase